ncbi:MAG: glycosyltransferase [Clostridium sp.]
MKKKVCMFVWNHFTNDARVLRECTALAESDYDVNLIAIHDAKQKGLERFERRNGFNITRVRRYPFYLILLRKALIMLKNNKILLIPLIGLMLLIAEISIGALAILLMIFGLLVTKPVKAFLIKFHIFLNMVWYGLKYNADIYHSNDLNTLPQGIMCSKILKRRKLIYDSHEVQSSRTGYGKPAFYIEKLLIKFIDLMIMTNDTRADYVQNLYKIERPKVVHNYPFYSGDDSIKNKYDLYSIANIPREKPILLYQGGMQQGRGLENIIDAINLFDDGIVVFIGDGKLKSKIIDLVVKRELIEKVRFLDKVPVDELKYYTANAYLGFQVLNNVCFNHYSACSNKLFEYIMSEVPVIACKFPEIKKVVDEEKVGICVDSHDFIEIANGVNNLLRNKEKYETFKKNCINAREKYNWNREKEVFLDIYNNIETKNEVEFEINREEIKSGL